MGDNRVRIYWRRCGPHGGGQWRAKLPDGAYVESSLLEAVEVTVLGWCEDNRASGYYIDRTGHNERGA